MAREDRFAPANDPVIDAAREDQFLADLVRRGREIQAAEARGDLDVLPPGAARPGVGVPAAEQAAAVFDPGATPRQPIRGPIGKLMQSFRDAPLRLGAGFKGSEIGTLRNLQENKGVPNVAVELNDDGTAVKSFWIRDNEKQDFRPLDPGGITDLPGDIADIGGDVVEAAPGAAAGLAVGGLPGAAVGAAGDIVGSIGKQAIGAALPGEEGLTAGERVGQGATNVAMGLVGEGVSAAGGKMFRGARRMLSDRLHPEKKLAREVAESLGQESATVPTVTGKEFFDRTKQIEDRISEAIGEPFRFPVGEATGDPAALLLQRTAAQTASTMQQVQRENAKKLASMAQFADGIIKHVAKNPDNLGKAAIGEQVGKALDRYIGQLREVRSQTAGALYRQAAELSGDAKIVPVKQYRDALSELITENEADSAAAAPFRRLLKDIDKLAENGSISIGQAHSLLKKWSSAAAGKGTQIEQMATAANRRIAGVLSEAVQTGLEEAATSPLAGQAVESLTDARSLWRDMSQEIDGVATSAVKRILKLSDDASDDMILDTIAKRSPKQLSGLMKTIDKADPGLGEDLRAQLLTDMLRKGGKVGRGAFGSEKLSVTALEPRRLATFLDENQDKLKAMFANHPKTWADLQVLAGAADRAGLGPGVAGSDTVPKLAIQGALEKLQRAGIPMAGASANAMRALGEKLQRDPEFMLKAMFSTEGADGFATLVRTEVKEGATRAQKQRAVDRINRAAIQLLGLFARGQKSATGKEIREEVPPSLVRPEVQQ